MTKLHRHISFNERFWAQVSKGDGCWWWLGAKNEGYGLITYQGKSRRATHASWYLATGDWPPSDKMVCHRCDNPSCVNPWHLFLGTAAENNQDAISKGRRSGWPRPARNGAANGRAKLSASDVESIRSQSSPADDLATKYGVAKSTIYRVRRGEWGAQKA